MSSLKDKLNAYKTNVQARLGEKFGVISGEVERVRGLGLLDRSLKVGQTAPAFTLPDAFGKEVSFKTLPATGPVFPWLVHKPARTTAMPAAAKAKAAAPAAASATVETKPVAEKPASADSAIDAMRKARERAQRRTEK